MPDAYDILGGPLKVTVEHLGGHDDRRAIGTGSPYVGGHGHGHGHGHGRGHRALWGYGVPYYGWTDLDAYVEPIVYVVDTTADDDVGADAYDILGGWCKPSSVGFDSYTIMGNAHDRWGKAPLLRRAPMRFGVLADTLVLAGGQTRGQQVRTGSTARAGVVAGRADTSLIVPSPDPAKPEGKLDKRGWNRARIDARALFNLAQKREPTTAEVASLKHLVDLARQAQANHDERNFEGVCLRLAYYCAHLTHARHKDVEAINAQADEVLRRHVLKYYADKPPSGFLGDIQIGRAHV